MRFLRARKWDVDQAVAMLCAALCFRLDRDIEGLLAKGENGMKHLPGFLNQFRRGISYAQGSTDKPGEHPIYFIHIARHYTSSQSIDTLQQVVLLAVESTRQMCTPPMERAVIVFDLTSFGLKNMDWQCVLFLVRCLEAYYPECLHRIYVHGAPWIFRGIWQVLCPMLDPVVRQKIKFTSKAKDLEEYIPPNKLSVGMGGTMEWEWDYTEPDPHENDLLHRTDLRDRIREERDELWNQFQQVTLQWCETESDEAAPELTFRRLVLQKQIRLKQLQLNPYIRATNVYQRQGILDEANTVVWKYPQADGSVQTQTVGDRHNIPALIRWLLHNQQDVFLNSYGTRFGACGIDRPPELIPNWVKNNRGPVSIPDLKEISRNPVIQSHWPGPGQPSYADVASHHAPLAASQSVSSAPPLMSYATPGSKSHLNGPGAAVANVSSSPDAEPGSGFSGYTSNSNGFHTSGELSGASTGSDGFATPPEYGGEEDYSDDAGSGEDAERTLGLDHNVFSGSAFGDSTYDDSRVADSMRAPGDSLKGEDIYDHGAEGSIDADAMSEESDTPETAVRPDYIPSKPLKISQVQITDAELQEDITRMRQALSLFLGSQMLEAEELSRVDADTRLYKAAGMGLINFVKSFMTFDMNDIETAIHCCKHTRNLASLLRKKHGPVGKLIQNKKSFYRSMTPVQLHAELTFAENMLMVCVLHVVKARGGMGLVKHALGLRSAYIILQDLFDFIQATDARAEREAITGIKKSRKAPNLDQDFRSGVYFAYAASSLVLSFLPGRAHKVLEGLGFAGDREFALQVLQRAGGWTKDKPLPAVSIGEEGVRRPLCDILLICYHVVLPTFVPVLVDMRLADQVLQWNLQRFPQGIFFLYFQARLYAAQALPEKAIEYFRNSIEAQRSFKQLDHISFFDLSLTYLSTCDFARAYECFDVLSRESNWSRAIYQYARAVCLVESGMDHLDKSTTIMRTVAGLKRKVAGHTIPLEQFVTCRAELFINQNNRLPLAGLEFSYLWHCISQTPVFLLVENTLTRIDDFIDDLARYVDISTYGTGESEYWSAYCLSFFLRGVALRYVAYPHERTIVRAPPEEAIGSQSEVAQDAMLNFHKVIQQGHRLDRYNNWLVYFAHYELGRLLECMGNRQGAQCEFELVLSGRPLEQHGQMYANPGGAAYQAARKPTSGHAHYLLERMCILRTQASIETMRIRQTHAPNAMYDGPALHMQMSSASLGSYSVGDRTSISGQSSFFAAAAPGTTLSDVIGHPSSLRAPSSHHAPSSRGETRRSDFAPSERGGASTFARSPSPPSSATDTYASVARQAPRRNGVPTSRMRSVYG